MRIRTRDNKVIIVENRKIEILNEDTGEIATIGPFLDNSLQIIGNSLLLQLEEGSLMKAVLSFDLDDYDSRQDLELMLEARNMVSTFIQLDNYLRTIVKYDHPDFLGKKRVAAEAIREMLHEILAEKGILGLI